MSIQEKLTQTERDQLLETLTDRQKAFINEELRRGRKSVFANVLAKDKAGSSEEGDIAEKWELEDYLDAGPNWQSTSILYCECGRKLRYQYIVKNLETNDRKKFGIKHFEEHTGIPPQLAKEIVNGIEKIDYEMDEVLVKISEHWTLADEGITEIPVTVDIPPDIQLHFDSDVPLLERQVTRLKNTIIVAKREEERVRLEKLAQQREREAIVKEKLAHERKVNTIQRRKQKMATNMELSLTVDSIPLDKKLQVAVLEYLNDLPQPEFRVSDVCTDLIENYDAPTETYSSGKPRIFANVCIFLEYLTHQDRLELVEKQGVDDRIYKLLNVYDGEEEPVNYKQESLFDQELN